MDSLVFWVFSEGTVVTDGMKIRSTPCFTRSRMWPWTSLAGKQTVSEVTADRPLSYIFRVLGRDSFTSNPRARKKVDQKGMVSQKDSTRGRPMTVSRRSLARETGYSWKSSFSRSWNRLGIFSFSWFLAWSCSRTASSLGSPRISPRSQRLLVTQELPLEKVMMVRLQWLAQKGQGELACWV